MFAVYSAILKYKYIRAEVLQRVLNGQRPGQDLDVTDGNVGRGGQKQQANISENLRDLVRKLVSEGFVKVEQRVVQGDKEVEPYDFYCVHFDKQLATIKYRLHKMRETVDSFEAAGGTQRQAVPAGERSVDAFFHVCKSSIVADVHAGCVVLASVLQGSVKILNAELVTLH